MLQMLWTEEVLQQVKQRSDEAEAKRNAELRQQAYNKGVADARRRCNNNRNTSFNC